MNSIAMAHLIAFGADDDLPSEVREWLRAGFRRYLSGAADLEISLRLNASNRQFARDQALRSAADVLASGNQISPWVIAGQLAKSIKRFESSGLLLSRRETPTNLTLLDQCLLQAFRTDARMIRSQRQLWRMLTNT